MSVARHL